jgi:hypothetical protein
MRQVDGLAEGRRLFCLRKLCLDSTSRFELAITRNRGKQMVLTVLIPLHLARPLTAP